jgi:hypothetical protein
MRFRFCFGILTFRFLHASAYFSLDLAH